MKAHIGLVLAAVLPISANCASLQMSKNVRVDVLEAVPIRDLWNVAAPGVIESSIAVVDYRAFDEESRPREGRWSGCAIVMIGTRDIGIKPAAIRIWTGSPCRLTVKEATRESLGSEAQFNLDLGHGESVRIRVSPELAVTINGKLIGRIED